MKNLKVIVPAIVLLIGLGLAFYAIHRIHSVDDVEIHVTPTGIEIRARSSTGGLGPIEKLVTIGPYINSITPGNLKLIRDEINQCAPKSARDVTSISQQAPVTQGAYAVVLLCLPSKDSKNAMKFDAFTKNFANGDLAGSRQFLVNQHDKVVFVLAYQGGMSNLWWLESREVPSGSKVISDAQLIN